MWRGVTDEKGGSWKGGSGDSDTPMMCKLIYINIGLKLLQEACNIGTEAELSNIVLDIL